MFFVYLVVFIMIFSFVIASVLPKKTDGYLLPFFVVLSVLIFIQQNIIVVSYGVLDGKNLDFTTDSFVKWVDIVMWLIAFFLIILFKEKITKNAGVLLTISGLVPVLILLNLLYFFDYNSTNNSASITDENKFTFSTSKKVLVFLLDGFQSDLFWEIIDKEPSIKNEFSGFEFYPNTSSVFAKTYPSIPLVLTGNVYQKQQPIMEFINESYEDSLLTDLKSSGWDVGLYPHAKNLIKVDESNMDNYSASVDFIDKIDNYLQALDLSLFRVVPHIFKKNIYNNGRFVVKESMFEYIENILAKKNKREVLKLPRLDVHPGKNFLEGLKTFSSVDSNKPTFRYYHLLMPHSPYLLNRELEYGNYDKNFTSYQNYAYASISLMISYINELKKLDIYNESAIIIVADHGGGDYTNKQYVHEKKEYVTLKTNGNAIASGKPLLLVKDFNDKKPFKISNKPISLTDIAPTISYFTGVHLNNNNGEVIYKIDEKQKRERLYYYYHFSGRDSKYLNDFNIFKINGNVNEESSWVKTGVLNTVQPSEKKTYVIGKTMRFGRDIKNDADYNNKFIVGDNYVFSPSHITSKNKQFNLSIPFDKKLKENKIYRLELELSTSEFKSKVYIGSKGEILTSMYVNNLHQEHHFLLFHHAS